MKIGDKVIRKWRPALGTGEIVHLMGEIVVVKWKPGDKPQTEFEEKKYLKVINEGR